MRSRLQTTRNPAEMVLIGNQHGLTGFLAGAGDVARQPLTVRIKQTDTDQTGQLQKPARSRRKGRVFRSSGGWRAKARRARRALARSICAVCARGGPACRAERPPHAYSWNRFSIWPSPQQLKMIRKMATRSLHACFNSHFLIIGQGN